MFAKSFLVHVDALYVRGVEVEVAVALALAVSLLLHVHEVGIYGGVVAVSAVRLLNNYNLGGLDGLIDRVVYGWVVGNRLNSRNVGLCNSLF